MQTPKRRALKGALPPGGRAKREGKPDNARGEVEQVNGGKLFWILDSASPKASKLRRINLD